MKFTGFFLLSILSIALATAWQSPLALAEGQGRDSGGLDEPSQDEGSAWFLGAEKTIRVCIDKAADFPLVDADGAFRTAFETWKKYIEARPNIQSSRFGTPPRKFPDFTLRFDLHPRCEGSEDLTLLLGVQTEEVLKARSKFHQPIAFAHRSSYSTEGGWGKGLIWVSNENEVFKSRLSQPYTLTAVLLHELGHVLGCGHVEGTIMESSLWGWLFYDFTTDAAAKAKFLNIDYTNQLSGENIWTAPLLGQIPEGPSAIKTFKLFAGRKPAGPVRALLEPNEAILKIWERIKQSGGDDPDRPVSELLKMLPPTADLGVNLLLTDSKGSVTVPIQLSVAGGSSSSCHASIFKKTYSAEKYTRHSSAGCAQAGEFSFGRIRDFRGAMHDVISERNQHSSPLTIRYWNGYIDHTLFEALPYGLQE